MPAEAFGASAGLLFVMLVLANVPAPTSLCTSLVVAANVAASAALWSLVRGRIALSEALATGVAGAFAIPAVLHLVVGQLSSDAVRWIPWVATPALMVALLASPGLRRNFATSHRSDRWPLIGGLVGAGAAVALNRWQFPRYPITGPVDYSQFHPDILFLQANSIANAAHPVGQIGAMSDWPARYHWLSYGWVGSLDSVLSLPAFTGLTRVLPLLAIIGLSFMAATLVGRWSRLWWLPTLAAAVVTVGRFPADSTAIAVNWDSPSQTSSTVLLLMGLLLLNQAARAGARVWRVVPATVLIAFATMGFKSSAGVVLLAALAATALVGSVRRTRWASASRLTALAGGVGVLGAFVALLAGNESGQALTPRWNDGGLVDGVLLGSAAAVTTTLALVPGAIGLFGSLRRRVGRNRPAAWFALGALACGLAAMWALAEAGPNNRWFLTSAMSVVWIVSAGGADLLLRGSRAGRMAAWAIGFAGVATLAWAWAASRIHPSAVVAELLFLAILGCALVVAYLVQRRRDAFTASALLAVLAIGSLSTPVWVVVAERAFPVGPTTFAAAKTAVADAASEAVATPLDSGALQRAGAQLSAVAKPGEVVALARDDYLPALFQSRTLPFVSAGYYVTHAGPKGTQAEYDRRRDLVDRSLASGDDAALCSEGIRWIVDGPPADLHVRAIVCP